MHIDVETFHINRIILSEVILLPITPHAVRGVVYQLAFVIYVDYLMNH